MYLVSIKIEFPPLVCLLLGWLDGHFVIDKSPTRPQEMVRHLSLTHQHQVSVITAVGGSQYKN